MDLIDRKRAMEKVKAVSELWLPDLPYGPYKQGFILGTDIAIQTIFYDVPPAEKTGKWIYDDEAYPYGNPNGHYDCDQCGESVPHKTNYCPNCGARMVE